MAIKKTLGGDRLGSGKKMQVELHGYERSTHDLSYVWRSTMSAGTLVPFLNEVALPGDTFDIDLQAEILTHPTIGPLFGSFKVQLDIFQAPIRLYNSLLHNNALNIGRDMAKVKLPQLTLTANPVPEGEDPDNAQINPSCILNYLGIRGVGSTEVKTTRNFNAVPLLAYWEIYKNYYANKQEEVGAVIHTPFVNAEETVQTISVGSTLIPEVKDDDFTLPLTGGTRVRVEYNGSGPRTPLMNILIITREFGTLSLDQLLKEVASVDDGTTDEQSGVYNNNFGPLSVVYWKYRGDTDLYNSGPGVSLFPLTDIDEMRKKILADSNTTAPFNLNEQNLFPYSLVLGDTSLINNCLSTQEGLGLKTYQSDLFNNWLSTEWIDGPNGVNTITAISTASGSFTIDTLNLSKKVYDMLNRIAVSGGTYDDWLDAVYAHDRYRMAESPIYHGGLIKELVFQEVISTNAAEADGNNPLGTLAGRGKLGQKHKGGSAVIKVDEPSYIMGIISLTPRVDYSQGNKWDVHLKTMDDLHKPALDEIGFQELITEQMAYWDTRYDNISGVWRTKSAGKQPAWVNYMTNVNQAKGNFAIASNQMFMTLNRRYEYSGSGIKDLTTYIDPVKFNFIFAQTSLDAQNFWAQVGVNMIARRKMSAKPMPNL